jgi:hypothetical protein
MNRNSYNRLLTLIDLVKRYYLLLPGCVMIAMYDLWLGLFNETVDGTVTSYLA